MGIVLSGLDKNGFPIYRKSCDRCYKSVDHVKLWWKYDEDNGRYLCNDCYEKAKSRYLQRRM